MLTPGIKGHAALRVTTENTALAMGSGELPCRYSLIIKGSYGELTPHPALRGHLQSTRQEPST